jgi:hypothetical protein
MQMMTERTLHNPPFILTFQVCSPAIATTHNTNTQITVIWEPPITGLHNITGYYYQFNDNSAYVLTMDNTSYGQAIYVSKEAPRSAVSPNYSNLDDKPIYCHVAAVNEIDEIIGPTQTVGPYRIDDIPPSQLQSLHHQ